MGKKQHQKENGASTKKIDSTVLVAIIGGIVTVLVTLITVFTPIVLKPKDLTPTPSIPPLSTRSLQAVIVQTPTITNDLLSQAADTLNDVKIIYTDTLGNFSEQNWTKWSYQQSVAMDDGALILTGSDNEDTGFDRNNLPIVGGQAILLHFKYVDEAGDRVRYSFGLTEMNKQWPQNRNFQIFDNNPPYSANISLHHGENDESNLDLSGISLVSDTRYGLLMTIGPKADLLAIIFDPGDPVRQIRYQEPVGNPDWLNLSWFFIFGLPKGITGSLYIKDFTEISYSSIK